MPLKRLDASKLCALGWKPSTDFRTALAKTYNWFLQHVVKEDLADVSAPI
jgi:GDP-L-fucose synthase